VLSRRCAKFEHRISVRNQLASAIARILSSEGVSVYWFTRGIGAGREVKQFAGDPLSPENKDLLKRKMLASFQRSAAMRSRR
jgi:hypothetical protein